MTAPHFSSDHVYYKWCIHKAVCLFQEKSPKTIFLHLNENWCRTQLPTFLTVLFRHIYSLSHCLEAWLLLLSVTLVLCAEASMHLLVMKYIAWNQLLCICIYTHIIFALTVWLKGGRGLWESKLHWFARALPHKPFSQNCPHRTDSGDSDS